MAERTGEIELDTIDEDNLLSLGSRFSRIFDTNDKTLHRFRRARDSYQERQAKRKHKRDKNRDE